MSVSTDDWSDKVTPLLVQLAPGARDVVTAALGEATDARSDVVGSHHLLLALLHRPDGAATQVLTARGLTYPAVRDFVTGMAPATEADSPPNVSADFVAVLRLATTGGKTQTSPTDLLVPLAQAGGPITRAVLDSYAVTVASLAARTSTPRAQTTDDRPPSPPELPDLRPDSSPLARAALRDAMTENLSLDGFVCRLLMVDDHDDARSSLALRELDTDRDDMCEWIVSGTPDLYYTGPDSLDPAIEQALACIPYWLVRTGDTHPDTVHLLLAALGTHTKATSAKVLKMRGVTTDLLVSAAVDPAVRLRTGTADRPGAPTAMTPSVHRGPAPLAQPAPRQAPHKLPGRRFSRRFYRSSLGTGGANLNSDLQMRRVVRLTGAIAVWAAASAAFITLVLATVVSTRNWWLLLVLLLASFDPLQVPFPTCVAGAAVAGYFVDWPAQVALGVGIAAQAVMLWHEVQWRKADVADPAFGPRRLRRDSWASRRSVAFGADS